MIDYFIERDDKMNAIENVENEVDNDIRENISDTTTLSNGYKFVKELILQHHNFDMKLMKHLWGMRPRCIQLKLMPLY